MPIEIESLGQNGGAMDMADDSVLVSITYVRCPVCEHRSYTSPCMSCKPDGKICLPCYYRGPIPTNDPPADPGTIA